ncbi:hypothetical protein [Porphyromonas gingivalis]|uniref:hypothetical protein n=1 Tax=Porphyromonas gingivalis TaxID=837 RepID=UPI0013EE6E57|nr:hypothetical protein [Porphyromonas gingivalis]
MTNSILHVFLGSNPHCFIAVRNIRRKGGRATPYSDSGYAVERTELRSTALRATL